ncbi:MAG: hypothetical protein WEC39_00845 [Patescibacteria group bacterium]
MKKILFFIIAVLAITQVFLLNSLVTGGRKMRELSARKEELNLTLSGLNNEIEQAASIAVIREKSQKMGLKPASLKVLKPAPVASAF